MMLLYHGFCKHIRYLEGSRNIGKRNNMRVQGFPNRMTVHLNMLCALMINRISNNLNSTSVVNIERSRIKLRKTLDRIPRSQTILEHAIDIARYSDSIEDLENRAYFLLFQEIKEPPRNVHQPETNRRVSGHPTQSKSL